MGAVDVYDAMLKKWTVSQRVGSRRDRSQWLKKSATYIFDIFLMNTYSLWRKLYYKNNPEKTKLPRKFHRDFQLKIAKGLLKKKTILPDLGTLGLNDQQNLQENVDLQKRRSRSAQRKRSCYANSLSPKPKQMRGHCYICQDVKRRTQSFCDFCGKFVCPNHILKATACSECMKTNFISKK